MAEPVGMRRNPNGALDPVTGYPVLVAVPLDEIDPATYGGLIAGLAVGPNGLARTITEVIFLVNPVDYFTRLMPATTALVNGTWVNDIFPFPTKVIQSVHVPQGEAIIGLAKRYFFGLGTGQGGKIEYSDHYAFLEDERYYLTKLYGDGKPLDSVSFKRLDISELRPYAPIVRVADYVDARLATLAITDEQNAAVNIGVFSENVHAYSGAVADEDEAGDNNVASMTLTTKDPNAVVEVKNGSNVVNKVNNAYALNLVAGANVITITSTVDSVEQEAYVIVLTYTPVE